MKNKKLLSLTTVSFLGLLLFMGAGCSKDQPLTEEQQAKKYNVSLEEYRQMKDTAARMNMTVEDHMKMLHNE
ncbi:MAG: hypothetical protein COV59_02520 [Candidatus Magasanikbacteria bacterium CG11_big_fil_rev_8_21_14_0_20_39_34]|uniref:Uncharacterized protein n=1 Tax=Candidatus Magasanikbacteria bacterium CG11_big_fil_rev_8_21_14_0_20_39_34 TaxID=1974653 RepID=A0A2H0N7F4_9BACT|nr:MAG: hypothetical protein COV59_02520 [Candidatus Magasanikbacteria bacterium CG11_big_fil_rev_8_21_14_0_20_39_34]